MAEDLYPFGERAADLRALLGWYARLAVAGDKEAGRRAGKIEMKLLGLVPEKSDRQRGQAKPP